MTNNPPKPKKIPHVLEQHGDVRTDNYYWLRDDTRSDSHVLDYLKAENAYAESWFNSKHPYSTEITNELIDQIPNEESSYGQINYGF
ncbi:S9 family peptidase, partial [Gammaproteobacteria bacterium]|nr:S9 family peptidase [Gammaproteobacteria bacterium]